MTQTRIFQADAFTGRLFAGNPAGVGSFPTLVDFKRLDLMAHA